MMSLFEKEEKHESFGLLSFSRVQSGRPLTLFGSDLKHSNIISMCLKHAKKERGLSKNWYHSDGLITEVYMSQNQFAELITSLNMGDGIPVTLRFTEKAGHLEEPSFASISETHSNEFKNAANSVGEKAEELLSSMKEILNGSGTVKKAERTALLNKAERILRDIVSNMPFMEEQFVKAMDKTVIDAKGTIEAFYQHRVVEAGLNALENDQEVKLIDNKD